MILIFDKCRQNASVADYATFMRQTIRSFNTPLPQAFELFKISLFKFPSLGAKLCSNALPKCWICDFDFLLVFDLIF